MIEEVKEGEVMREERVIDGITVEVEGEEEEEVESEEEEEVVVEEEAQIIEVYSFIYLSYFCQFQTIETMGKAIETIQLPIDTETITVTLQIEGNINLFVDQWYLILPNASSGSFLSVVFSSFHSQIIVQRSCQLLNACTFNNIILQMVNV